MLADGQLWTLNGSEWPSAAAVCSLLDTLETGDIPLEYSLSSTACTGILRRAKARGKLERLPGHLRAGLEAGVGSVPTSTSTEES